MDEHHRPDEPEEPTEAEERPGALEPSPSTIERPSEDDDVQRPMILSRTTPALVQAHHEATKLKPGIDAAVDKALEKVGRKVPPAVKAVQDLVRYRLRLREARDLEHELKLKADKPVYAPDGRAQGISTLAYVAVVVPAALIEWFIDRGALLVFHLPATVTAVIAIAPVFASVVFAHLAGRAFKRRKLAPDASVVGSTEGRLGIVMLVAGIVLAGIIGVIRSFYGGLLSGTLFGVLGVGLFLAMTLFAYLHYDAARSDHRAAKRARRHAEIMVRWATGRAHRVIAKLRTAQEKVKSVATSGIARVKQVFFASYLMLEEEPDGPVAGPEWTARLYDLAAGKVPDGFDVELPADADLDEDEPEAA